jgi:hypothetical protein
MSDNNLVIDIINDYVPIYIEKSAIMDLVVERLAFGQQKYGHGIRVNATNLNDYNNNWTESIKQMDWASMMLEEAIDGMVYSAAEIIRVGKDNHGPHITYLKHALEHMANGAISMLRYKALSS